MGGGDFSAFWSGGMYWWYLSFFTLGLGSLGFLWRFLLSLKDLDCKGGGETARALGGGDRDSLTSRIDPEEGLFDGFLGTQKYNSAKALRAKRCWGIKASIHPISYKRIALEGES